MRTVIASIIAFVSAALVGCAYVARRSDRDIAPKVTNFLISLLPPMIGNLIIIIAHTEGFSLFGRYLYAVGIDITMCCLLDFTLQYCGMSWDKTWQKILTGCVVADILQLLCNPFFGHAFAPDMMMVEGAPYYNVKSYIGRNLHLALIYAIMAVILIILLVNIRRGARIYSEKYSIIFLLLLFTGAWEIFYIFSHTPVKSSLISYGVFGLLVFYFSLYYRPMRLLDHLLADVASGLTDGLFFFDREGKCLWADEHGEKLIGAKSRDFSHYQMRLDELFPNLELEKSDWNCRRSVGERHYNLVKHTVFDTRKRAIGSVLSVMDETENELALKRERYIANHDSLTDIFTKEHLFRRVRERIDENPEETFYIAYMDVNNFKLINDVFGHDFGDYTLQSIARDLKDRLPPEALYGRIGNDTFGACLSSQEFDIELAEKFLADHTIRKDGIVHEVLIHEGVYEVTDRDIDVSVMFDRAKMALQTIKGDYLKHVAVYDDTMREKALRDQSIAQELPSALENRDVRPYLQAIVDRDGKVIGAEALVRWIHPVRGFMSPAQFIPVIEQNGMIADVDRYMWRCACEILKDWERMGRDDLFISVNVSPKDFYFMDVNETLKEIVTEYDIPPSRLRIEITETLMMNDNTGKLMILQKLQEAGFVVEMDDFGSGYSSLNLLRNMPVDIIKIDMMFIRDMQDMQRTSIILQNMINMMNELGLVPITEGVETEEQYRILSQMGGKLFQGYLFARPMPVEEFEKKFVCAEDVERE